MIKHILGRQQTQAIQLHALDASYRCEGAFIYAQNKSFSLRRCGTEREDSSRIVRQLAKTVPSGDGRGLEYSSVIQGQAYATRRILLKMNFF